MIARLIALIVVAIAALGCIFEDPMKPVHPDGTDRDDADLPPLLHEPPMGGGTGGGGAAGQESYSWTPTEPGAHYYFDGFNSYQRNIMDPDALTITIPDAVAGARYQAVMQGTPRAEWQEEWVSCELQLHALQGGNEDQERPITTGGFATFPDLTSDAIVVFRGLHEATEDGQLRIRLLGRSTYPDRFCGLGSPVSLLVTRMQ